MLPLDLFEPDPEPVARLVNLSAETRHIQGSMGERIRWWLAQSPDHRYIGRGSPLGNPYSHLASSAAQFQVRTRDEAVDKYRPYLLARADLLAYLETLRGTVMGCWCVPKRCHGEVLLEFLNKWPL